jgi:hypothetical protein
MRADVVLHALDPADINQWVIEAKDNNPAVLALRSAIEVARLEVEKAAMARLPSLNALASYGRDFSSGNDTNPVDFATNARICQRRSNCDPPFLLIAEVKVTHLDSGRGNPALNLSGLRSCVPQMAFTASAAYIAMTRFEVRDRNPIHYGAVWLKINGPEEK